MASSDNKRTRLINRLKAVRKKHTQLSPSIFVQMPLLNGFEATRAIREKERERGGHIPIIAMTANAGKEDEERCFDSGMDAFISKPIDFMKCLELIGQTIKQNYDKAS